MNSVLRSASALVLLSLTSAAGGDKLVASVPENMSWTIVAAPRGVEDKSDSAHANRKIRVVCAHARGLRKFSWVGTEGRERTLFLVRTFLLEPNAEGHITVTTPDDKGPAAASPLSPPVELGEFAEFGWVSTGRFCGMVDYAGRRCAKYEQAQTDMKPSGANKDGQPSVAGVTDAAPPHSANGDLPIQRKTVSRTAYIDTATRLPVALVDLSGTYEYAFKPLTEPLVLPPEYAAALRETAQRVEKARNRYRIPQ